MSKVSELSVVELFGKFYSQSLTAAAHIQKALVGSCLQVTVGFEKTGNPDLTQIQAIVDFMQKKDPTNKLVQTNSIISWYVQVAGVRISNIGKSEPSIVRPNRMEGFHNREWADAIRTAESWSIHGRKIQEPKPVSDPTDQIARQMATYVAMGGMVLSDLEIGMPLIVGKVKSLLKDPAFCEKIEERMTKLDERGMEYVKA